MEKNFNFRVTLLYMRLLSNYSLSLVFRLGFDFVLPLSQEQEEQEPPTKIYQKEVYYRLEI